VERIFSIIAKLFERFATLFLTNEEEKLYLDSKEIEEPAEEVKVEHQKRYLWILDNGHGVETSGKRSPRFEDGRQLLEYEFNRAIVKRIIDRLDELGVAYLNLVPGENDVPLADRVALASTCDDKGLGKVYVSVHGNAATDLWSIASGVETYHYPNSQTGISLATVFQKHIVQQTEWKDRGIKEAKFYVLRKTTMPAILTENGFFSNKAQCEQMLSMEYRDKVAEAHVQAILEIEKDGIQ